MIPQVAYLVCERVGLLLYLGHLDGYIYNM